ncbi:ATP-binding protein [Streptomyces sp. CA-294286]|uniref:ATP-binding protein n=1 Tax=Streptomyces sp. CA-294286 TaxID=3240070 RepID=UPI003D91C572
MNHTTDAAQELLDPAERTSEPGYRTGFAVGEHSARHMRRILRMYLAGWGLLDLADAAELAFTELIANVVRHVPGRHCRMCILLCEGEVLRVEVADDCPALPRPSRTVRALAEGGRGLLLVDAVTDDWGVEPLPGGGKTVWFECRAVRTGDGADR